MELKDFISQTIYEISMGIEDAKHRVFEEMDNQPVSPGKMEGKIVTKDTSIDFDLSVTNSFSESNGKKIGIIKVLDAGINKEMENVSETINRIKFSVPFYPQAVSPKKK